MSILTNKPRRWVIGRAPECDVVLRRPEVSARHCRLTRTPQGFLLEDLGSSNGTFVNGTRVQGRVGVSRSDQVTLGQQVPFPWPDDAGEPPPPPPTRAVRPARSTETVSFTRGTLVLGRDPGCDEVLDSPMISARHARLTRQQAGVVLEDLRSAHGTFVNGARIDRPVRVRTGDVIGLGSFTFTFTEKGELQRRDYRGNFTLEARDVGVRAGRRLLVA